MLAESRMDGALACRFFSPQYPSRYVPATPDRNDQVWLKVIENPFG